MPVGTEILRWLYGMKIMSTFMPPEVDNWWYVEEDGEYVAFDRFEEEIYRGLSRTAAWSALIVAPLRQEDVHQVLQLIDHLLPYFRYNIVFVQWWRRALLRASKAGQPISAIALEELEKTLQYSYTMLPKGKSYLEKFKSYYNQLDEWATKEPTPETEDMIKSARAAMMRETIRRPIMQKWIDSMVSMQENP